MTRLASASEKLWRAPAFSSVFPQLFTCAPLISLPTLFFIVQSSVCELQSPSSEHMTKRPAVRRSLPMGFRLFPFSPARNQSSSKPTFQKRLTFLPLSLLAGLLFYRHLQVRQRFPDNDFQNHLYIALARPLRIISPWLRSRALHCSSSSRPHHDSLPHARSPCVSLFSRTRYG